MSVRKPLVSPCAACQPFTLANVSDAHNYCLAALFTVHKDPLPAVHISPSHFWHYKLELSALARLCCNCQNTAKHEQVSRLTACQIHVALKFNHIDVALTTRQAANKCLITPLLQERPRIQKCNLIENWLCTLKSLKDNLIVWETKISRSIVLLLLLLLGVPALRFKDRVRCNNGHR